MGQSRETPKEITLDATGGAADVQRVWDNPTGSPFRRMYIYVSTAGEPTAAGDLDYEILVGGRWIGTPFDVTSTHIGGLSQIGVIIIPGGTEISEVIWDSASNYPANRLTRPLPPGSGLNASGMGATPIVVEFTNHKAVAQHLYVTFVSESIDDRV